MESLLKKLLNDDQTFFFVATIKFICADIYGFVFHLFFLKCDSFIAFSSFAFSSSTTTLQRAHMFMQKCLKLQ